MKIPAIRLLNQQLLKPLFSTPKEVVSWMGAMQAQDAGMVKWAVGIRTKAGTLPMVEKALQRGEILRTHVMRPTWHLVAAEDIRWMLKLSAPHVKAANDSYAKGRDLEITEELYKRSHNLLEKILCGGKSLTKQEITDQFLQAGIQVDVHRMNRFVARAELEGIVCSGEAKGSKHTYALLEERVPPVPELTKDEALARLGRNYFRSHTPATLQDFIWWSGLSTTEARQAIYLLGASLTAETWNGQTWYLHEDSRTSMKTAASSLHLLPSYDEYLLGYKDRTDVLPKEHYPKAFTNNGLFFPIILSNGEVTGNWSKPAKKGGKHLTHSFFRSETLAEDALLNRGKEAYLQFISSL